MKEKQKYKSFKSVNYIIVITFLMLGINCSSQKAKANLWVLKSYNSEVQDQEKMALEEILKLERKLAAHPFRDLKIEDQIQIDSSEYCIVKNRNCFRWSISDTLLYISKSDIVFDYKIIQQKDRMIISREKYYGKIEFVFEKY